MERSAIDLRDNLSDTFIGRDELNSQIQSMRAELQLNKNRVGLELGRFTLI